MRRRECMKIDANANNKMFHANEKNVSMIDANANNKMIDANENNQMFHANEKEESDDVSCKCE